MKSDVEPRKKSKARGGPVIAIVSEGDKRVAEIGRRRHLRFPGRPKISCSRLVTRDTATNYYLAYHIRGDAPAATVDKPRNLAKEL